MANEYVTLDLEKPEITYVDLRKNFQGRVGDSLAYCKLWIKSNGLPKDLSKLNIGFAGVDPDGDKYHAVGWAAADQPGDNIQVGRITYYFPAGIFQVEGDWDTTSTYFYIDDDKTGQHISTINVWLHVLPNMVEMGINAEPYKNDLDRALGEFKSYLSTKKDEMNDAIKALDASAIMEKVKSLNDVVTNYTTLIKTSAVPTKIDMQNYVSSLFSAEETNKDLDLLMAEKTYIITNPNAGNNPSHTMGTLKVFGDGNSNIMQMFVDTEANLWVRSGGSNGWSDWREQTAWN